ncbi:MAG: hypothetical protein Q4C89_00940 [Deinococcus sp.]|uniref:hypothetical protein n=1 Tax=Deinococcus sp. TaxID=47478 RepID=UPI0026DD3572|nr:hypothetical protein [Deinococcus sp.]MDO4244575.1 hypothetical protein [Deinococcus sp.]
MIDPKTAENVARAALAAARDYFDLSHEWDIKLKVERLDDGEMGRIDQLPAYMRATIKYDSSQVDDAAELWSVIGHEVAHLAFSEHSQFGLTVEKHLDGPMPPALFAAWQYGNERAVSRLQRMFVRDRPLPGLGAASGGSLDPSPPGTP